jgi:hypothetical protein
MTTTTTTTTYIYVYIYTHPHPHTSKKKEIKIKYIVSKQSKLTEKLNPYFFQRNQPKSVKRIPLTQVKPNKKTKTNNKRQKERKTKSSYENKPISVRSESPPKITPLLFSDSPCKLK